MKKTLIIITLLSIALSQIGLIFIGASAARAASQNVASENTIHSNLVASVTLPDALHPKFAPVVVIKGGNEADYGNYFLQLIAGGLLFLAAPVAVLVIVFGAITYMLSMGEQNTIDSAKKTLMYGIIGLLVTMFSFAIVRLIIEFVVTSGSIA